MTLGKFRPKSLSAQNFPPLPGCTRLEVSSLPLGMHFDFFQTNEFTRYEISAAASAAFEPKYVIACIEKAKSHETGRLRHVNLDSFPHPAGGAMLCVLRSRANGRIVVVLSSELPTALRQFLAEEGT